MALYQYRAADEQANIITGRIRSADEHELERELYARGMLLIHAEQLAIINAASMFASKFSNKELLDFTYMLRLIVNSGLPFLSGLNNIRSSHGSHGVRNAADLVVQGIESGLSISEIMQNHPSLFPAYYVQIVRAGEISGCLGKSLDLLMDYISWRIEFRKTLTGILAYPAMVLATMSTAILIVFTFVLPRLLKVFTKFGGKMPLPTRIMMAVAEFMADYLVVIIPLIVLLIITINLIRNTENGRYAIDAVILKTRLVGELVAKADLSRYFKIVATLHAAGVTVTQTFHAGAEVVQNQVMAGMLREVPRAIFAGVSISQALSSNRHIPPMIIDMIALAEKTGDLDGTLNRVGEMLDKEVPERIRKVLSYLEPLTIIVLGGMVLLLLLSIFLPIYKTVGLIRVR
jgi:type II secretory pathway component PulF